MNQATIEYTNDNYRAEDPRLSGVRFDLKLSWPTWTRSSKNKSSLLSLFVICHERRETCYLSHSGLSKCAYSHFFDFSRNQLRQLSLGDDLSVFE